MLRIVRILAPNPGLRELEGTNTWVVGDAPAIVIDPGPDDEGHLREVAAAAGRVGCIVLTHDHPDHAPGAAALSAATGARVWAARPPGGGSRLREGQVISSGRASLTVVATPGHSPDSICLFAPGERALFTGDTVLGRGTSVIDPPEGDLIAYLRSLRRMRELEPRTLYPGHGPTVFRAIDKLDVYLEHRAMREEQVLAGLAEGPRSPEELVPAIYGDHPEEVHELAARSVLAHLIKLEGEGRVERTTKGGSVRFARSEPRSCERCGRPVRGRARLCGACSLATLQESG